MPSFEYIENIETPSSLSSSPSVPLPLDSPVVGDDVSSLVQPEDTCVSVYEPRDAEYYLDTVIFNVEDTLYKVPRYHFLQSQDFFASKFAQCKSEIDVIRLDGVSKDDFRTFLKLLYPLSIMSTLSFTTEEWITVLKLSTEWTMLDVRNLAIRQLNAAKIDPVDRIVLAQKYSIPQWLNISLIFLIRREGSLTMREAEKLGFQLALKICRVRDSSRILPDVLNDYAWSYYIGVELRKELSQLPALSVVDRIVAAREKGVLEFLKTSYLDLIQRSEPLSDDEAVKLGCETTARICRAREQRIAQGPSTTNSLSLVEDGLQVELDAMKSMSATQRVVISRGHVAEWLQTSLVDAAQRRQFSGDEVESLGMETMIRLYRVREAVHSTQWGSKPHGVCQTGVNVEFSDELRAARDRAKRYSGTEEATAADTIIEWQASTPEGPHGYESPDMRTSAPGSDRDVPSMSLWGVPAGGGPCDDVPLASPSGPEVRSKPKKGKMRF